jgi:RNA polymerase sigma factor (sigma-70 family)
MAVAIRANHQPYAGDEHQLVAAVRAGDDAAFGLLYERYRPRIGAYVQSMVSDHGRAEDIAQEVFISALRRLRATDRPVMFKPWLYEIAKNACIDEYRRIRRTQEIPLDGIAEVSEIDRLHSTAPTPHAAIESKMRLDDLRGAFRGLSDSHHQILVLRELEGLSYNQIGDRLGISKPVVESTLFRARRRLGEEFAELESGRRCARVQGLIECVADGRRSGPSLGLRERRLLSRHLSHCDPCKRQARLAGVDIRDVPRKPSKLAAAALLPIPWLRWRRSSGGAGAVSGRHAATVMQAAQSLAPAAGSGNPFSGLGRAAAAVIIGIVGAGGGLVATQTIGGTSRTAPRRVVLGSQSFGTPSAGVFGAGAAATDAVSGVIRQSVGGPGGLASTAGAGIEQTRIALTERIVALLPFALVSQGWASALLLSPLTKAAAMPAVNIVGSAPPPVVVAPHGTSAGGPAIGAGALGAGASLISQLGAPLSKAPVATTTAGHTPILNLGAASKITNPVSSSAQSSASGAASTATQAVSTAAAALPVLGSHHAGTLGATTRHVISGAAGAAAGATAAATGAASGATGAATGTIVAAASGATKAATGTVVAAASGATRAATGTVVPAASNALSSVVGGAATATNTATSAASGAVSAAGGAASAAAGAASAASGATSATAGKLLSGLTLN